MKLASFWLALAAAASLPGVVFAQNTFDNSGNSLLRGTYFVRYLRNSNVNSLGVIGKAQALTATAMFDGNGKYTLAGQLSDNTVSSGSPVALTFAGSYAVNASGVFKIDNPVASGESVFGGVGKSAIVGSSVESTFLDFLVAIPMAPAATNASLNGTFRVVSLDYPNGDVKKITNSTFLMNANGSGALGAITVSGHAVNVNDKVFTQQISGATYSLSGSTGTLTFPSSGSTPLLSGAKQFFVSADGNILVGGAANGYDVEVGIKVSSTGNTFAGVFFSAGQDHDSSWFANNGYYYLDAFYGSSNSVTMSGATTVLSHQRINPDDGVTYDYTFDNLLNFGPDGVAALTYSQHFAGAGGTARLVTGLSTNYVIELDVLAQTLPVTGSVVISPVGVVNTANYLPVTNPVAPGEFITLFGSGLGPASPVVASVPFRTMLGGVGVTVNGRPAVISVVSATQVSFIVPYATTEPYAVIQLTNNNVASNLVTLFADLSAPGVFTQNQSGTGAAAALHPDGSLVTASNPARAGETIAVYASGLGTVTPTVADGAPAPGTTLSRTDDVIDVYVDGTKASTTFSGLAPTFAGLYQVNFVVPAGTATGPVFLDLADQKTSGYNSMALLSISGSAVSASEARMERSANRPMHRARGTGQVRSPRR